jgi:glycosyltransferase involved in cell wall biosynthesis
MIKEVGLVSVIMNCYNGEEYLNEAIESVLKQTYENFEIIFWDNLSTDKTRQIVKSYDDSRIRYFIAETHVNLGEARNLALKKVKGDYICFLDVDDFWDIDKLQLQTEHMYDNPEVIVSYSFSYEFYGKNLSSKKCIQIVGDTKNEIFFRLFRKNFINWQTVMIRKELAGDLLVFDNHYNYLEDLDILLSLSLVGPFDLIKKPLVFYRRHDSNLSLNWRNMLDERFQILRKYKDRFKGKKVQYYRVYIHYCKIYLYSILFESKVR